MSEIPLALRCEKLNHAYGTNRVLYDVDFSIARGQIVAIVGPSGCGKSTLFRSILGTQKHDTGNIVVVGADGASQAVHKPGRDRGIVYQNYALFDFLTVLDNVAFGLMLDESSIPSRLFRYPSWKRLQKKHREQARALLRKVQLIESADKYPAELSGGMRQRVAIAQALIMKPDILLLDEPFGALDEATREDLQRMLLQIYADNISAIKEQRFADAQTILMVTHELSEAIFVSDRILGLSQYWDFAQAGHQNSPGATIVYDKPAIIYHPDTPKHHEAFVAQRDELYDMVFAPETKQAHQQFVQFWNTVRAGGGKGVLAP